MKTFSFKFFMIMGLLSLAYGCSSDENVNMNDTKFEELIMDDNIGETWNGSGLPSWFYNRVFNYVNEETEWFVESYRGTTLYNAYKLNYKNNLLLLLNYDRFGYRSTYYAESGTVCFTNDGRKVNYAEIKDKLKGEAELVWTNELGSGEYAVKVADANLDNVSSLNWLQQVVDRICQDIKEPEQVLCKLAFGYAYDEAKTYVVVDYKYFDKNCLENGQVGVRNVYTLDGKMIEMPNNLKIEKLCVQRITDILQLKL